MEARRIREQLKTCSIYDLPLRVTFYARVSTDKDEQLNSLENQEAYFTEKIRSIKHWTFIPGYIEMLTPSLIQMHPTCTQIAP